MNDKLRNINKMIHLSYPSFQHAHQQGVMGVPCVSRLARQVALNNNQQLVDFVRCNYLGLDSHPEVLQGAHDALTEYQSVHWSCARTRLNYSLLTRLEEHLSILFKAKIVVFSSVTLANMGALPLLSSGHFTAGKKPLFVFDKHCHASLAFHKPIIAQEAPVLTLAHNDLDRLESLCQQHTQVVYVADGIYSMGGNAPMADLRLLQDKYDLFLYIDDAHGISITGRYGEGFARSSLCEDLGIRTIIAASLGKGFGSQGGFLMLGRGMQEQLVRYYAQPYAFSAAPNIPAVGAAMASARLHASPTLSSLQMALRHNLDLFDKQVWTPQTGEHLPIRMLAVGHDKACICMAKQLMTQGFYVSAVFFPTVAQDQAALRICISADHQPSDILQLCHALQKLGFTKHCH